MVTEWNANEYRQPNKNTQQMKRKQRAQKKNGRKNRHVHWMFEQTAKRWMTLANISDDNSIDAAKWLNKWFYPNSILESNNKYYNSFGSCGGSSSDSYSFSMSLLLRKHQQRNEKEIKSGHWLQLCSKSIIINVEVG